MDACTLFRSYKLKKKWHQVTSLEQLEGKMRFYLWHHAQDLLERLLLEGDNEGLHVLVGVQHLAVKSNSATLDFSRAVCTLMFGIHLQSH